MYRIGVITASDKAFRGEREDKSGLLIRELLAPLGTVEEYRVLPDDREAIKAALLQMADELGLDLVLTTGERAWVPGMLPPMPPGRLWTGRCRAWRRPCGPRVWSRLPTPCSPGPWRAPGVGP